MNRRQALKMMFGVSVGITTLHNNTLSAAGVFSKQPVPEFNKTPNIVLVTVDDMNYDTPGCFGGPAGLTPNIDKLATEGMRFEKAHVTLAICQPSRQALMTGRYPHNAGYRWFEPVSKETPILMEILKNKGYMNACVGKAEHLQPRGRYQWTDSYDLVEIRGGRNPVIYHKHCKDFIKKADQEKRPFFLMANSHDPHRPFHGSAAENSELCRKLKELGGVFAKPSNVYEPKDAYPLGFLPDIPVVSEQTSQYMSSCSRADDTVGQILKALDETGHSKDTIVFFLSDNGSAFPFAKGCVYFNSTRTPFIVRWPGQVAAGSVNSSDFINGIDFMPTVLEILGQPVSAGLDGKSFLPLLKGQRDKEDRNSTVTVFYNVYPVAGGHKPEQTVWFEMRCLHAGKYGYIYNKWVDGQKEFTPLATPEILAEMKKLGYHERLKMFRYRCPEELYDFDKDPDALNNLAEDEKYRPLLQKLRLQLLEWMISFNDTDLLAEYEQMISEKTASNN
jgi:N-sulfoglucosamine sulfohydrolase